MDDRAGNSWGDWSRLRPVQGRNYDKLDRGFRYLTRPGLRPLCRRDTSILPCDFTIMLASFGTRLNPTFSHIFRSISISAFQGFLPPPKLAAKVVAPPYDVLDSAEARVLAADNPLSFLHVNKPEIDLPVDCDPYSDLVYATGKANLSKFIENGWLQADSTRRLYVYAITMGNRTQVGVVAGASVEDYAHKRIKVHELTRKKKELDRTKLTDIQGANAGPVFLMYRDDRRIDEIVRRIETRQAYIDVIAGDGNRHVVRTKQLWKCEDGESNDLITLFQGVPEAYIADGHHRAASAYNVALARMKKSSAQDTGFFLSILYSQSQLKIFDYNRVLKPFANKSRGQILEDLKQKFQVTDPLPVPSPPHKGFISFYMDGHWAGLTLKPNSIPQNDLIRSLDSQILTDLVLGPVFGITDLRSDERIDFVGGIHGLKALEKRCEKEGGCAFALHPLDVTDVMKVADAGLIMPPKSTWFEPKPRSGMVVRVFGS